MTCASEYIPQLHLRGFRVTSQRMAIHHLICRECGSEIEVEDAIFKKVFIKLESISQYVRTDHHVSILGICPSC